MNTATPTDVQTLRAACNQLVATAADPTTTRSVLLRMWALGAAADDLLTDLHQLAVHHAARTGTEATLTELLHALGRHEEAAAHHHAVSVRLKEHHNHSRDPLDQAADEAADKIADVGAGQHPAPLGPAAPQGGPPASTRPSKTAAPPCCAWPEPGHTAPRTPHPGRAGGTRPGRDSRRQGDRSRGFGLDVVPGGEQLGVEALGQLHIARIDSEHPHCPRRTTGADGRST